MQRCHGAEESAREVRQGLIISGSAAVARPIGDLSKSMVKRATGVKDAGKIDPWNPPHDLPRVSRFIAACWTCGASGRVECASCRGTARRPCTGCDGSGKYYGQAANGAHRLLNCKTCRGKGDVRCADCTRGKVDCETCHQAKKLACWLEVRSDLRQDVQLAPEEAATLPFSWCRRGASVADDQFALDARIVDKVTRTRPVTATELPATAPPEWRSEHGPRLQAHVEPGERVRSQSFTFLSVPFASVTYAVLGEQHAVALEGLRMLAPPVTAPAAEPFTRRARMLGRLALAFAALPIAIAAIYAARGEYFTIGRASGLVAGVAIAAAATAALAYAALWNVTLGRRRARTWAMAAIAPVTIASLLAAVAEPRVDRARDLLEAGRLDEATAELRALNLPEADAAWADLHLRRSLEATTCATATAELRPIPPDQRGRAQAHADQLAIAETEAALRAHDPDAAATALGCTSEPGRTSPTALALRARIADLQAGRCLERKDWACALERAASGSDPAALRADALSAINAEARQGLADERSGARTELVAHRANATPAAAGAGACVADGPCGCGAESPGADPLGRGRRGLPVTVGAWRPRCAPRSLRTRHRAPGRGLDRQDDRRRGTRRLGCPHLRCVEGRTRMQSRRGSSAR